MNEELIMKMVEPSVKNGVLTYELFDKIFSMLSLREQYQACEILYKNSIQLLDSFEGEEISLDPIELSETEIVDNPPEDGTPLYDDKIFKDASGDEEYLFVPAEIKQSNDTLVHLIRDGSKQARQDLCIKNEKLVRKYANAYFRLMGNDLEFDDLMQAGFIGLLTAAEKFDFGKDSAFSTYSVFWIKQAISRHVFDQGYRIRIPVHLMERISKATRLDSKYAFEGLDYRQRIQSIAEEMAISENKVEELFTLKYTFLDAVSLDTPVGEEEETSLGDFIPSNFENDVESQFFQGALSSTINDILKTLTPREERVIRSRFGLDDGHPKTLEAVGKEFNVTRERIRQIEAKALRKLRHPSRSKKLKDYLTN